MAWKETCVRDERMCFVASWLSGDVSVSELCRHFGVSRKTGHKWLNRYQAQGPAGLEERSRAPRNHPQQIDPAVIDALIEVRQRHRSWGPRKVKAWLEAHQADRAWPAASTIGAVFDRAGLTRRRKRSRRVPPQSFPYQECRASNDVWSVDFKGWFLTGDGIQVDPLTISDGHSRYLLRCEALGRANERHTWPVFESAFYEYGLPLAVRSDNGPPFAGRGPAGLSRLAVKLIKAGIRPERIEPGKPQQNGRHERMHLTLKQETATPPARSLRAQMERFALFRASYNDDRPHEALGQVPPSAVYQPSPRRYDGVLHSPDYPADAWVRRVRRSGEIKWKGRHLFISEVLVGEPIGLFDLGNDVQLIKYGPVVLGTLQGEAGFERIRARPRSRPAPYRP